MALYSELSPADQAIVDNVGNLIRDAAGDPDKQIEVNVQEQP